MCSCVSQAVNVARVYWICFSSGCGIALCVSPETEVLSNSPECNMGICASADFYFICLTVYINALQVNSVILWEVMNFFITPQKMCV